MAYSDVYVGKRLGEVILKFEWSGTRNSWFKHTQIAGHISWVSASVWPEISICNKCPVDANAAGLRTF